MNQMVFFFCFESRAQFFSDFWYLVPDFWFGVKPNFFFLVRYKLMILFNAIYEAHFGIDEADDFESS